MSENTAQVLKKLTITRCEEWRSGTDKNQRPYTIWKVEAVDEAGQPVDADLRAFVELEIDVEQEFEVLRYDPDGGGSPSFTLKPKRGQEHAMSRAELVELVRSQDARIERLESKVKWMYDQVSALVLDGSSPTGASR